jgi:hypothetical protein
LGARARRLHPHARVHARQDSSASLVRWSAAAVLLVGSAAAARQRHVPTAAPGPMGLWRIVRRRPAVACVLRGSTAPLARCHATTAVPALRAPQAPTTAAPRPLHAPQAASPYQVIPPAARVPLAMRVRLPLRAARRQWRAHQGCTRWQVPRRVSTAPRCPALLVLLHPTRLLASCVVLGSTRSAARRCALTAALVGSAASWRRGRHARRCARQGMRVHQVR